MSSPTLFLMITLLCTLVTIVCMIIVYSTQSNRAQSICLVVAIICVLILAFISKGGPFNI